MPPLTNNPKYNLWKERADKEGTTSANRSMTDDFISTEVPTPLKQVSKDIVETYRSVVDFPSEVFRILFGVGLIYFLFEINKKK